MELPAGKRPISINHLGIMTARLRIFVAASACLLAAGSPALGQDSAQQTAAPSQNAIVGPPQLSNFSLNGTVTRAAPAPTPVRSQPSAGRQPSAAASTEPTRRREPVRTATASSQRTQTPASREPPESRPEPQPSVPAPVVEEPAASSALADPPAAVAPAPADIDSGESSHGMPILPWIIAALAALVALVWFFFFRNRRRESYPGISSFGLEAPAAPAPAQPVQPRAAPQLRPAAPKPAAPPAAPTGVVSTLLRPWLEIEFKPDRAIVDDNRAAVAFEIFVVNSGSVPARDVLLEASLFNAGPVQDQQIQLFFDNPVAQGDRIPVIPPLQRVSVNTAVFLARDQVRPIEIEGRQLFVPMVAFNALYGWGGREGQTSASYLVGRKTDGDKLAPLRLDLGPRIFRGLDARVHELRVRK
jgi:hypothetical protein